MKRLILFLMLAIYTMAGIATDRNAMIKSGLTTISPAMVFTVADAIDASQTVNILVSNPQKFLQHQTFTVTLDNISGTTDVVVTAYGKVASAASYVQIGDPVTLSADGTATVASATPKNYNYLKLALVAGAGAQHSHITAFDVKTSNVYDVTSAGLTTFSSGVTSTGGIVNLNASSNYATNINTGTTNAALTLGGGSGTVAVNSSDWDISTSGAMTGIGAITSDGTITTSGIITGGLKLPAPVLNTDGTETLAVTQSGKMIVASKSDGATTVTLPDPSAASVGVIFYIMQTADQNLVLDLSTANGNFIVCDGVATTDAVTISTASHKIGAGMIVIGISATQWYVGGLNPESVLTPEVAD